MSAPTLPSVPPASHRSDSDRQSAQQGLGGYTQDYIERLRAGDTGSLPALLGLAILVILFTVISSGFLTINSVESMVVFASPTIIMAMGLVFVLLLGEIDLSAGTISGVCGGITGSLLIIHHHAWWFAVLGGLLAGAVIGLTIGLLRSKVGIPSFVITLAYFLGFQGVQLFLVGSQGLTFTNGAPGANIINDIDSSFMPVWLGWTILVVMTVGYAALKIQTAARRRKHSLPAEPISVIFVKIAAMAVCGGVFVYFMSLNRFHCRTALCSASSAEGLPWVVGIVLVLFLVLTFVLSRTRYGRHLYAVGGNAEAARRAGIRVDWIRTSVFVIGSFLAALSGLVADSQSGSSALSGTGNVLLLAVGAAVIGGTSLFGGRGRIVDAIVGGLVVEVISYGISNLIQGSNSAAWEEIITGLVLLLAAGFDAVSRRGTSSSGSFSKLLTALLRREPKN
ncbi:MAG TPA: ABC transporter permease [Actinocrinis sp.]|nr:ABC transporter permease [Actinocrinis sp.]